MKITVYGKQMSVRDSLKEAVEKKLSKFDKFFGEDCSLYTFHLKKYAGISDNRNIVLSMAIAGALAGGGSALYWLSGNTEFYWSTYQSLPATGFNGIPVALLAANNPIGVIFSAIFISLLNMNGLQLKTLTAYNEYITDIIISSIVYLSSFSLIIKLWLTSRKKKAAEATAKPVATESGKTPAEKTDGEEAAQ